MKDIERVVAALRGIEDLRTAGVTMIKMLAMIVETSGSTKKALAESLRVNAEPMFCAMMFGTAHIGTDPTSETHTASVQLALSRPDLNRAEEILRLTRMLDAAEASDINLRRKNSELSAQLTTSTDVLKIAQSAAEEAGKSLTELTIRADRLIASIAVKDERISSLEQVTETLRADLDAIRADNRKLRASLEAASKKED